MVVLSFFSLLFPSHIFKGDAGEEVEKIYQSVTQKPDDQSALIETEKCRSQEVEMNECRHVKIGEF